MTKYEFDKEMNRVNLRYEETRTSMQREIDAISLEKKVLEMRIVECKSRIAQIRTNMDAAKVNYLAEKRDLFNKMDFSEE